MMMMWRRRAREAVAHPHAQWLVCFNRIAKVTPDVFEDWMQILQRSRSRRAVLLLMAESAEVETHVRRAAASRWGSANRLLFLPRLTSKEQYRALLRLSDLFLDTRIYGAHTVASDAMFEGTPVITLPGEGFASRVSLSLNEVAFASSTRTSSSTAMMMTMVVPDNRRQYVDVVCRLLRHHDGHEHGHEGGHEDSHHHHDHDAPHVMHRLRSALRSAVGRQLFNSSLFAEEMERGLSAVAEAAAAHQHQQQQQQQQRLYHIITGKA